MHVFLLDLNCNFVCNNIVVALTAVKALRLLGDGNVFEGRER